MGQLTVINRQRYLGHKPGSVIVVQDSFIVRALLKNGRLDLVDPPELPSLKKEEASNGNESSPETGTDQELPDKPKRTRNAGPRKASAKRSAESEGTGSEGSDGGLGGFIADSQDHTKGEADRTSDSES